MPSIGWALVMSNSSSTMFWNKWTYKVSSKMYRNTKLGYFQHFSLPLPLPEKIWILVNYGIMQRIVLFPSSLLYFKSKYYSLHWFLHSPPWKIHQCQANSGHTTLQHFIGIWMESKLYLWEIQQWPASTLKKWGRDQFYIHSWIQCATLQSRTPPTMHWSTRGK